MNSIIFALAYDLLYCKLESVDCLNDYCLMKYKQCGRKLHNEELHNLYSSPSTIRMIKSRWMRWIGHVERMVRKRNAYRIFVGKPEGKRPKEDQYVGGWIILKWILER
jgi:hypothetical protein